MNWLLPALLFGDIVYGQGIDVIPLDVDVPHPPIAVPAGGKQLLVYELHVTNVGNTGDLTLLKVEMVAGSKVAELAGDELDRSVRRTGPEEGPPTLLRAGVRGIVNLFFLVDSVPNSIGHTLTILDSSSAKTAKVPCAAVRVSRNDLRLSPPIRGDHWVAVNGPGNGTHHRRSFVPINGRIRIPQRFAIDWVRPFPDGKWHEGDPLVNKNHRAYGAAVLAVANARVLTVKDGIPDNTPDNEKRAVAMTFETMGGNHVVLDLGKGKYAFYAHLQPGSIRVKPGERVRKGQVLGLIGNSGNSSAPHLHFQVSDGPVLLEGEGLPYVIDRFYRNGRQHRNELPLQDWAVDF